MCQKDISKTPKSTYDCELKFEEILCKKNLLRQLKEYKTNLETELTRVNTKLKSRAIAQKGGE